jgi:type IV secretion system protein VirB9
VRRVALLLMSLLLLLVAGPALAQGDPRLREQVFDARAVVTVPVQRGVVTLIELGDDEAIAEVAAGLGGRHLFVKPRSTASAPNTLAVVTDRRVHSFRLVLSPGQAVYRLKVRAPVPAAPTHPVLAEQPAASVLPPLPVPPSPQALVAERLQARPVVRNSAYSMAEGPGSEDIVPSLVFDDGRFTYLRLAGNREVPAVFTVLGDGSEALVNVRMEDDLLVVDRVSRRLMLRAGQAVVGLWNDAFDIHGVPPTLATTVPGVERRVRLPAAGGGGSAP